MLPRSLQSLRAALAAIVLLSLPPDIAGAGELRGRVVGITDGDTLTLLMEDRREVRVRLAEIDTPERSQPHGDRARMALSALAFGEAVRAEAVDTDRYGRTVARVHSAGRDVNAEMVQRGAAWVSRRYSRDPELPRLEEEARAARRGLWGLPEAERVPPWEVARDPSVTGAQAPQRGAA